MGDIDTDKQLDDVISNLSKTVRAIDDANNVYNLERISAFKRAKNDIRKFIRSTGCRIKSYIHKPYKSTAYISIVSDSMVVTDPEGFCRLCMDASNIECLPRMDGNFEFNLTYNSIMKRG